MPKFIEVKRAESPKIYSVFGCNGKYDPNDSEYVLINVEHIASIIPKEENFCIITMACNCADIYAQHSATWVMGLINGHQ